MISGTKIKITLILKDILKFIAIIVINEIIYCFANYYVHTYTCTNMYIYVRKESANVKIERYFLIDRINVLIMN